MKKKYQVWLCSVLEYSKFEFCAISQDMLLFEGDMKSANEFAKEYAEPIRDELFIQDKALMILEVFAGDDDV